MAHYVAYAKSPLLQQVWVAVRVNGAFDALELFHEACEQAFVCLAFGRLNLGQVRSLVFGVKWAPIISARANARACLLWPARS